MFAIRDYKGVDQLYCRERERDDLSGLFKISYLGLSLLKCL